MSLFDHLVERALDRVRPVEPLIEPSPLGPTPIGPSRTGFDELSFETPAPAPSPVRPGPAATAPAIPAISALASAPSPRTFGERPSTVDERIPPRVGPLSAPVEPVREHRGPGAVSPTEVVRERSTVVVEQRKSERVESIREIVRERSTVVMEPALPPKAPERAAPLVPARREGDSERLPRRAEPGRGEEPPTSAPGMATAAPVLPAPRRREPAVAPEAAKPRRAGSPRVLAPAVPGANRVISAESGPTLRIEIGRVIVRAEVPPSERRERPTRVGVTASLAEYLAKREREDS